MNNIDLVSGVSSSVFFGSLFQSQVSKKFSKNFYSKLISDLLRFFPLVSTVHGSERGGERANFKSQPAKTGERKFKIVNGQDLNPGRLLFKELFKWAN